MSQHLLIAFLMVFVSGIGIAMQAPINGALGAHINSGLFAALISFGVGFSSLLILNLTTANFAPLRAISSASPWMLIGGFLGAFAVYSSLTNVAKLGSLTLVATILCGQLTAAMIIDAVGFANLPAQSISPARILAVVLIALGVVLSRY
ncbi:MAG: DMT family transporter [Rhizobiaceae bacterium]|nr:DMT family transporter [Rhizobiaceae bacterium]